MCSLFVYIQRATTASPLDPSFAKGTLWAKATVRDQEAVRRLQGKQPRCRSGKTMCTVQAASPRLEKAQWGGVVHGQSLLGAVFTCLDSRSLPPISQNNSTNSFVNLNSTPPYILPNTSPPTPVSSTKYFRTHHNRYNGERGT